jgi:acetyl-CoA carboxylase biotin carboxyl carrier protein
MMAGGIQFDPKAIRELANILRETDLSEIELVEKDSRLRVARTVTAAPQVVLQAAPAMAAAPAAAGAAAAPPAAVAEAELANHPGALTSPMVGVAYLAPEPGALPFVQVGAKVAQGQTVLLIEAMKTFNQIKAPRAGTVTRILIESGTPVEFGEALLIIE